MSTPTSVFTSRWFRACTQLTAKRCSCRSVLQAIRTPSLLPHTLPAMPCYMQPLPRLVQQFEVLCQRMCRYLRPELYKAEAAEAYEKAEQVRSLC